MTTYYSTPYADQMARQTGEMPMWQQRGFSSQAEFDDYVNRQAPMLHATPYQQQPDTSGAVLGAGGGPSIYSGGYDPQSYVTGGANAPLNIMGMYFGQGGIRVNPDGSPYQQPAYTPTPEEAASGIGIGNQGGTSQAPTAQPGTSTAQGVTDYYGYRSDGRQTPSTPAPLGGEAPLSNAVLQGFGVGLAPFNAQYYDQIGKSMYDQANQNYLENLKPALDSNAIMSGGYGGDRAALAQGAVMNNLNRNVTNAMAPMYAQGYENSLNRNLDTGKAAMGGVLGLGGLDIDAYNAQTQAINAGTAASGTPVYSSPWASAIGAGGGLYQLGKMSGWWG